MESAACIDASRPAHWVTTKIQWGDLVLVAFRHDCCDRDAKDILEEADSHFQYLWSGVCDNSRRWHLANALPETKYSPCCQMRQFVTGSGAAVGLVLIDDFDLLGEIINSHHMVDSEIIPSTGLMLHETSHVLCGIEDFLAEDPIPIGGEGGLHTVKIRFDEFASLLTPLSFLDTSCAHIAAIATSLMAATGLSKRFRIVCLDLLSGSEELALLVSAPSKELFEDFIARLKATTYSDLVMRNPELEKVLSHGPHSADLWQLLAASLGSAPAGDDMSGKEASWRMVADSPVYRYIHSEELFSVSAEKPAAACLESSARSMGSEADSTANCLKRRDGGFSPLLSTAIGDAVQRSCLGRPKMLRYYHQTLRIPVALRRTIERLFREYCAAMRDEYSFDVVVDLDDAFLALYLSLQQLSEARANSSTSLSSRVDYSLPYLSSKGVEELAAYVSALENALRVRKNQICQCAKGNRRRLPHEGGIGKWMQAAEAVLKCGSGLLRDHSLGVEHDGNSHNQANHESGLFGRVGVVNRIVHQPGARCCFHPLTAGPPAFPLLATIDVDIWHVLHPASYLTYLHETAHFILNYHLGDFQRREKPFPPELRSLYESEASGAPSPRIITTDLLQEHISEAFAIFLSHLFVYGRQTHAPTIHYILSFDRSPASVGVNPADADIRFIDHMIRIFLAKELLARIPDKEWTIDQCTSHGMGQNGPECKDGFSIEAASRRFADFFEEYCQYSYLYCSCRDKKEYDDFAELGGDALNLFRTIYQDLWCALRPLAKWGREVWRSYKKNKLPSSCLDGPDSNIADLGDVLRDAMISGQPPLYSVAMGQDDCQTYFPDPLLLISLTGSAYVSTIADVKGHRFHLMRPQPEIGKMNMPDYTTSLTEGALPWYEFQVSRDRASLYCPVPAKRRERLRKQAVMRNIFWNMSASMRLKRIIDILKHDQHQDNETLAE